MDNFDRDIEIAEVSAHADQFRSVLQQRTKEEEIVPDLSALEHDVTSTLEREETALSRIRTHESQHTHTVASKQKGRQSTSSLPPMGAGKPYPDLTGQEDYVVEFDGADDPIYPQNWSTNRR
jgi:MFS transporter, DHA1 family, multidrug resistance protein